MKRLLTFTVLMLALCAGAQYPPPYVHNYWSTQAQAQVNSPIMNSSHEVTNFVNNGQTLSSIMIFGLGNLAAESGKVAINDDGSGNFANNTFRWTTGGAVTATSFTGDGSGLTGLPSGGTGIATNGGSGLNNWMTNALIKSLTNSGPTLTFFNESQPLNPIFITNINSQFMLGQIGNYADLTLKALNTKGSVNVSAPGSFNGSGSGLTGVPDSALSANVPLLNANQTFSGSNGFSAGVSFNGLSSSNAFLGNQVKTLGSSNIVEAWGTNVVLPAFTVILTNGSSIRFGGANIIQGFNEAGVSKFTISRAGVLDVASGITLGGSIANASSFASFSQYFCNTDSTTGYQNASGTGIAFPGNGQAIIHNNSGAFAGALTLSNLNASATVVATNGIVIPSGTNRRAGNATLVGGTITVNNTSVATTDILMLTRKTSGGTIGTAITYTLSAATSFTINSDNILDTSTFSWMLVGNPP